MRVLVKNIDIYGTTFTFRHNGHDIYKTTLGGFFSILTIFIIFSMAMLLGKDFIYSTNPQILFNTIFLDKYDNPVKLTEKNFIIAWRIEAYNKTFLPIDNVLYPAIIEKSYKKSITKGSLELEFNRRNPLAKCNQNSLYMDEFSKNYNLNDWYCFDWAQSNSELGGFWDGEYVHFHQLHLYLCKNEQKYSSIKSECTTIEDFRKFVTNSGGGLVVSIVYPQHFVEENDEINPLHIAFKNSYYYFNEDTLRINRLFFNEVNLRDDQGWIFEDIKESSVLSISRIQDDLTNNEITEGESSLIYEFNLYMDKSKQTVKRSYMKVQDLGAKLGGTIKFVMIIFQMINSFFSYYNFQIASFDEMFTYEENTSANINILEKYEK